jgi:DNA repair protein RadC
MHVESSSLQCPQSPKIAASPACRNATPQKARRLLCTSARSRLLKVGTQALSDVELLSLILRSGKRTSAHDLGADLLTAYGSLRALLVADPHRASAHGLTPLNYAALQAALEIARRHYQELMMAAPALKTPRIAREFFHMRMRDLPYEVFAVLYLDNRDRVIQFKELFRGTIDGAAVHTREVVKDALAHNAAAVMVAHNHPSGLAEPSQADELVTRRLKEALALVDIRLIDHLIVGDGHIESFAERGLP